MDLDGLPSRKSRNFGKRLSGISNGPKSSFAFARPGKKTYSLSPLPMITTANLAAKV